MLELFSSTFYFEIYQYIDCITIKRFRILKLVKLICVKPSVKHTVQNAGKHSSVHPKLTSKAYNFRKIHWREIPAMCKKILLSCGYDKMMMLAEIDEAKLAKIEEFVIGAFWKI